MQNFTLMDLVQRTMLGDEQFYDAAEVDPVINQKDNRIEELERALKSCKAVLERKEEESAKFVEVASAAIHEATRALMVT